MADQVGLRVRNQNRILQIDGEYQNLELVLKANYSIPTTSSTGDMWGASVDVPSPPGRTNVVLAIQTTAPAGVYFVKTGASTFRIYRGSGNGSTDPVLITVYFFAAPLERSSAGGVGIVVRNITTGLVVFNSNYKYLRILQFANVNLTMPQDANVPPTTATFSFAGKTLAIVQCVRPNGRRQTTGGPPQQPVGIFGFFGGTMRTDGASTATITHRVIASAVGPAGSSSATQTLGTYMIVDVTGF